MPITNFFTRITFPYTQLVLVYGYYNTLTKTFLVNYFHSMYVPSDSMESLGGRFVRDISLLHVVRASDLSICN